jgi:hypothetical protein
MGTIGVPTVRRAAPRVESDPTAVRGAPQARPLFDNSHMVPCAKRLNRCNRLQNM